MAPAVFLVHNGIIENYQELKDKLVKSGYTFYSQTDTEIAVKLVDYYYKKTGTPLEALTRSMLRIRGSYAFGVMFHDHPGKLFAARKDSPLIIGRSSSGSLIASQEQFREPDRFRCAGYPGQDKARILYR